MKSKLIMILAGVLALQLLLVSLLSIDTKTHVKQKEMFLATDTSQIDYVKIVNSGKPVALKRVGANWRLSEPLDFPANPRYIETMLKKLAELKVESHISSNKNKYDQYELSDTATYVEAGKEGGKIDKFYIGKQSSSYSHTYMRKADDGDVLLVVGTPRSSLTRDPNDWRDKSVLSLDKSMLEKVVITFSDEVVELVRDISSPSNDSIMVMSDTTWNVIPKRGKPFKADDKVLNRVRNTITRLNASDFLDKGLAEIPSFDNPELIVDAYLEGNQHERLEFIPMKGDDDNKWLARKNGNDQTVYVIFQSSVTNLKKRADDFRPKPEDKDKNEV